MRNLLKTEVFFTVLSLFLCLNAFAGGEHETGIQLNKEGFRPIDADGHAPIGVMGDHTHNKGEWMLSYRYMYMDMSGNRSGSKGISTEKILDMPNRFFGKPGQPPKLRIVPTDMKMSMHMLGAMYAPDDRVTMMVMLSYMEKSMRHITFNMPGTSRVGNFKTKAGGIGDTKLSALIRLFDDDIHNLHLNMGLSLPSGSNTKRGDVLTPMGTYMNVRLPYAMQPGSGTFDLLPGLTYTARLKPFGLGAQYVGTFRANRDNGYNLGDKQDISAWISYQWRSWISISGRMVYLYQENIEGIDPQIVGPVQTADPNNYGGDTLTLLFGVNFAGQTGLLRGNRIALEAGIPVYQDLNGTQLETDFTITAGWQYTF